MKLKDFRLNKWALAALMGMFTLASCSSDDDNGNDNNGGDSNEIVIENGSTLNGTVASGKTALIKEGYNVKLSGEYIVEDGATLKIEPGVTITAVRDETPDYILIKQGGKIDAQGTANNPIVMTAQYTSGEVLNTVGWGGIHICGKAHTNKGTGTKSEIGNAPYGSGESTANDNDNSGILRYIRLEYTGFALDEEHEANGVSFYGVGSGTTVDHIQVYKGGDDGFEFFGGSVNVKYLVATDCEDDSFDWTEGWNGKAQFLVATQAGTTGAKDNGDCLIEADNNGDNNTATPYAHPILSNLTLIGNNSENGTRGIRLRAGTEAEIYNTLVTGKPKAVTVETQHTEEALSNATSKLEYITVKNGAFDSKEGVYTQDKFLATANNNTLDGTFSFSNSFVGTIDGGKDLSTSDSFFTKAIYRGAVGTNDTWTSGTWIK